MKATIGENQFIMFEKVISRHYRVQKSRLSDIFQKFLKEVLSADYSAAGPFFYSIYSEILEDGTVSIDLFLPVHEENQHVLSEEFLYHSYFQILNMVATRVEGDSELAISKGLANLAQHLLYRNYTEITPPFYLVYFEGDTVYTDIMIGIDE